MADPHSSGSTDLHTLLYSDNSKSSSILNISKAYKFFTSKWNHDHGRRRRRNRENSSSTDDTSKESSNGRKNEERITGSEDATTSWGANDSSSRHQFKRCGSSVDDSFVYRRRPSFLYKSASRRSQTPTPSSFSRTASRRSNSVADFLRGGLGSRSRRESTGPCEPPETATAPTSASRSTPTRTMSSASPGSDGSATPTSLPRSMSSRQPMRTMSRTSSSVRRGTSPTPIVFSQTAARKKPQPIEKKLECTLEELLHGCVKKVVITRNVLSETGVIQEEETLKINVEPGWRKGTKVMFEGKGDEKPGYLPADIVFVIEEARHPLFKRRGDDLEIAVEIPLVKALAGCALSVPLLSGEKMALRFDEIVHPGYEKAIPGQGMPCSKDPGRRGDLRISFFVEFPAQLSEAQRLEIHSILME